MRIKEYLKEERGVSLRTISAKEDTTKAPEVTLPEYESVQVPPLR